MVGVATAVSMETPGAVTALDIEAMAIDAGLGSWIELMGPGRSDAEGADILEILAGYRNDYRTGRFSSGEFKRLVDETFRSRLQMVFQGARRFSDKPPEGIFISPALKKLETHMLDVLVLQVLEMSEADFEIMRAGGLPPNSPASVLVQKLNPSIRRMTKRIIDIWNGRGVRLDFDEVLQLMRAALPLFLKEEWKPNKLNPVLYIKIYFPRFFTVRFLRRQFPLVREVENAMRLGCDKAGGGDLHRAAYLEVQRRSLLPYREPPSSSDDFKTPQTIWDKLRAEPDDTSPGWEKKLVAAVGASIDEFLRDPTVIQLDKEVFLLSWREGETLASIGRRLSISRQRVHQRLTKAVERWRVYLEAALREMKLVKTWKQLEGAPVRTLEEVRDVLTREEMEKVMRSAGFRFLTRQPE